MEHKTIQALNYLRDSNVRILVDYEDYDIEKDNRVLIPFHIISTMV